jgi:hypothetical protein
MTNFDGIVVPTGFATDVGITRTYYSKQSSPFSNCVTDSGTFTSTYFSMTVNSVGGYVRLACYEICMQFEFMVANCSCLDSSVNVNSTMGYSYCKSTTQLACVNKVRNYFNVNSLADTCSTYCPDECERFAYGLAVRMADYPTDYYYNVIAAQKNVIKLYAKWNKTLTKQRFSESTVLVNVFYDDLVYSAIVESPSLTLDQVVGVIGM